MPAGTAMSIPSCMLPQRIPNPEATGPSTGQMNPLEPPRIGPGRDSRRGRGGGGLLQLLLDLALKVADVALELLDVGVRRSPSAACLSACAADRSASRASSETRVRVSSRFLAAISSRAARIRSHGVLGLVPQVADPDDDVLVLLLDPVQVLVSLEQVLEAIGLEDHREHVRGVRLVDRDEAPLEHVERALQPIAEHVQVLALGVELGLLLLQLLLDDRLAVAKRRHLALQLLDLARVAGRARCSARPAATSPDRAGTAWCRAGSGGPGRAPSRRRRPTPRRRRAPAPDRRPPCGAGRRSLVVLRCLPSSLSQAYGVS